MRSKLPVGMTNPNDLPGAPQPMADLQGHMDHQQTNSMREAQLVSLARTCLKHAKFGNLSAELITDASPESAAAWQRAKLAALAGDLHNGQDPRSIAWQSAVNRAVTLWASQAQLSLHDYLHIDMRQVFRAAIRVEFGEEAVPAADPALTSLLPTSFVSDALPAAPTAPLPSTKLQQRRAARAQWSDSIRWDGRRPVAILDGRRYNLCLNGHRT